VKMRVVRVRRLRLGVSLVPWDTMRVVSMDMEEVLMVMGVDEVGRIRLEGEDKVVDMSLVPLILHLVLHLSKEVVVIGERRRVKAGGMRRIMDPLPDDRLLWMDMELRETDERIVLTLVAPRKRGER